MVNFYHCFLPGIARTLAPLTDALKGGRKGPAAVAWGHADGVSSGQGGAVSGVDPGHPDSTADLSLMVDASETHVGAVLQQRERGSPAWRPLGFLSHKLAAAQTHYSAFDRDLLAIYSGIRCFRYMLEGRQFIVFTDYKPLTFALHKQADRPPAAPLLVHCGVYGRYPASGRVRQSAGLRGRPQHHRRRLQSSSGQRSRRGHRFGRHRRGTGGLYIYTLPLCQLYSKCVADSDQ
jgi:hypothetical protein